MGRKQDSRSHDTRLTDKSDKRPKYDMDYTSAVHIPDYVKKEGFDYFLERLSLKGKQDNALDNAYRRGWRPVPVDRDPHRFVDPLKRNPLGEEFICIGDTILLEREKELSDKETGDNEKKSRDRLEQSEAYNYKVPMGTL